jgi:hypothetical protein
MPASTVCGIDLGSLRTPAYVAWLRERDLVLDLYIPLPDRPLPAPPPGWPAPLWIGVDGPQGLPRRGEKCRRADREARVPTQVLPRDRAELVSWRLYRGLIETGIELFWAVDERRLARVLGLDSAVDLAATICETYPRHVLRRLWPDLKPIPSKRNDPLGYLDAVWPRLRGAGYVCPSVLRPTVDQVDAMLCAVAAEACRTAGPLPAGTVGEPPFVDREARVLREGWIVAP